MVSQKARSQRNGEGITGITVCGYKSVETPQTVEFGPLTLLAGANSSGKSSIMQPLLLLKQTLDAPYDPGALRLDGDNVKFTSATQLLSMLSRGEFVKGFYARVTVENNGAIETHFKHVQKGFDVAKMGIIRGREEVWYKRGMSQEAIKRQLSKFEYGMAFPDRQKWTVVRNRCFLELALRVGRTVRRITFGPPLNTRVASHIRRIIHLPGLRGNPERVYPDTAVGSEFPGTFEKYVASVIAHWQARFPESLRQLSGDLKKMCLTRTVKSKRIDDTHIQLAVGRRQTTGRGGAYDLVNIADVGFGVSQALPVLVALRVAKPGQMVYLEQPEIHLHPKAQLALAGILAEAANRGVRVVAETHSALLLLGIQTLVAKGNLVPEIVKLHWFTRGEDGCTEVKSANLDKNGAFGDWPEDFGKTELQAEGDYLDAAEMGLTEGKA